MSGARKLSLKESVGDKLQAGIISAARACRAVEDPSVKQVGIRSRGGGGGLFSVASTGNLMSN